MMKPMERFARRVDTARVLKRHELSAMMWAASALTRGWAMDPRGFVSIERDFFEEQSPLFVVAAREHNDAKMARARGRR